MDLLPTRDQLDLVEAAAEFLGDELPASVIRVRRGETDAVGAPAWRTAAQLGLLGLSLPEVHGGLGLGLPMETLVYREIGRRPSPGPFLSTSLAARVAAFAGDADLAAAILAGDQPVGLALGGPGAVTAEGTVDGALTLLDASPEGLALLVGHSGAGLVSVSELDGVEPVTSIDPGVRVARAVAARVTPTHYVPASTDPIHLRLSVLAAALLTGMAEGTRDMAVEYAKVREQFGRPIGAHQAIKHRCADMAVAAEAAVAQTTFAAIALESGRPDAEFQTATAMVVAHRSGRDNAAANVQIHGGIGYTYEHDAHLFVKRAEIWGRAAGEPAGHLSRVLAAAEPV
ncbi:acyl-CoA dehydrogenase family protein [Tomitella biformata]|uniref:acyl-CoA dehydrogenase family protein n=1 Tax=Tomitella biformata TaxID=630403 RepID=UPI0004645166|nr:acyl-CoA dehydrogenase family protein [Tomitella biformata]